MTKVRRRLHRWQTQNRTARLARLIAEKAPTSNGKRPVAFFNASTRIESLSLNAAFSLLTSWSLRLSGVPVMHFVCQAGLRPCVLGTNRKDYTQAPPCAACLRQSSALFAGASTFPFVYQEDPQLSAALAECSIKELVSFEYYVQPIADPTYPFANPIPLGRLVLPSLRWALRVHHLPDDEPTRYLFRQYILSAYHLALEFNAFLAHVEPSVLVLFNGIMYPEATARWVAQQHGLRVITHEVGFQRFSAFFTEGEATAYPLHIPDGFELTETQNRRLDEYLENRFQGNFTMAGIRFWPEMRPLDKALLQRIDAFRQVVPVFTNVVFDSSQVHANVVFPHMFAWLDLVLGTIRAHPETLFVIRAHPDEMRPGSDKKSRESVHDWIKRNGVDQLPNVIFIDSREYLSSYELIQRAKFVMVYNSSIGLEAAVMGAPVLCGGKARYTQYPIVYFPSTPEAYRQQAEEFLAADEIEVPAEFRQNARRFLYYQFFRTSLPFSDLLQPGERPGFVEIRPVNWKKLLPEHSPIMRIITEGILNTTPPDAQPFYWRE